MQKRIFFLLTLSAMLSISYFAFAAKEEIILSTYYPAPYGEYEELRAKKIALGEHYSDPAEYSWGGAPRYIVGSGVDLIVEGKVGIGTLSPTSKLDVSGDIGADGIVFKQPEGIDDGSLDSIKEYVSVLRTPKGLNGNL